MNRRVRAAPITAVLAALLVLAPAAVAHVTLNPREWEAGGFAKFDMRVPNENESGDTTKIVMRFPEQVISASFQPVEGWKRTVKMAKLDEPIDDEGEQITERIDTVTWSGGRIRPGEFQEFGISFQVPEDVEPGTALAFPSLQTYTNPDEVRRWIGPEDADSPAPTVTVLEAPPEEGAAEATPAPTAAEGADGGGQAEEEGGTDTLSIIALIVGIAGLIMAMVALFSRGRRSEVPGQRAEAAVR
jgi:uncharacterized protein YcnI